MATFSFTGWTSQSAAPSTLASRVVNPTPQFNTDSSIGPLNAAAQNPVTADALKTTPATLADSTLGSRQYQNPLTGQRDAPIVASVYAQPNTPAFLQESIDSLNANQSLRRATQAEWMDRLFKQAAGGDYLAWEALRAGSVQPGAKASFGAAVQDPLTGKAMQAAAQSDAALKTQQARALQAEQDIKDQIATLTQERDQKAQSIQAGAWGDRIGQLNQQIAELTQRAKSGGQSTAGSGWVPSGSAYKLTW